MRALLLLALSVTAACVTPVVDEAVVDVDDSDPPLMRSDASGEMFVEAAVETGTDAAPPDVAMDAPDTAPPPPTRVGLFAGVGAGAEYVTAVSKVVASDARFVLTKFTDGTVDFKKLDVVVMPGGSGSAEWKSLGTAGQESLRSFLAAGGGYIGICAGFYVALSATAGLIPAQHYEPWARGEGSVAVKIAEGNGVLTLSGTHSFRYVNGPVVYPLSAKLPGYTVLATFAGNIGRSDIVSMVGKPAIVAASYGSGRVVAFSPHPELSGFGALLNDAIRFAAASP